jgi:hypothetical protein
VGVGGPKFNTILSKRATSSEATYFNDGSTIFSSWRQSRRRWCGIFVHDSLPNDGDKFQLRKADASCVWFRVSETCAGVAGWFIRFW